jgi:hypothetical protein
LVDRLVCEEGEGEDGEGEDGEGEDGEDGEGGGENRMDLWSSPIELDSASMCAQDIVSNYVAFNWGVSFSTFLSIWASTRGVDARDIPVDGEGPGLVDGDPPLHSIAIEWETSLCIV